MRWTGAISVSRDDKWIVCGTFQGASVWDTEIKEKAIQVEGTKHVTAVDVSHDTTRFTTGIGNGDNTANIWDIFTGKRLVGPFLHDDNVLGVKFSPNGEHFATVCADAIHVFNSRNGDHLNSIKVDVDSRWLSITPLVWSNNGEQIFVICRNNIIKAFEVSTGSLQAKSQVDNSYTGSDSDLRRCIALATNGKFLASFLPNSISFWDTLTLARIGTVIEDSQELWSIALSADCRYLATGRRDGKITIRNLSGILPDAYASGSFHVSICAFMMLAYIVIPLF